MKLLFGTTQEGKNFHLPLEIATEKTAFIGRTGSGKTYGATKLAELLLDAGVQIIALDPVGVWRGLRIGASFPIYVFGGMSGDFPLESTAGAVIADLIVDRSISAVLDVSQFETDTEKARFAAAFADRFFFRKKAAPSAVHIFVEEAQEFVPQNTQKGEERMLHSWQRIWKLGRNFGIGGSLISQRPQEVNKKALNQSGVLFAFQLTGMHERKAVSEWMAEKGITAGELAAILPKIEVGSPHVWSPNVIESGIIHIAAKKSSDVSSTPKVGVSARVPTLSPIDAEKLKADMAATVERAQANDPELLKKEISRLKAEIIRAAKTAPEKQVIEVPVLSENDLKTIEETMRSARDMKVHLVQADQRWEFLHSQLAAILSWVEKLQREKSSTPISKAPAAISTKSLELQNGLNAQQRKILSLVHMFTIRGIVATRDSVAAWLGIHPKGGTYGQNIAALRAGGYLENFTLTPLGDRQVQPIDTGLNAALDAVENEQQRMILGLCARGKPFTRDTLAEELGIHPKGGTFGQNIAHLRTMGLIPKRGDIRLTEAALQ